MTREEARDLIDRAAWKFAKSTADVAPHEYIVGGWDRDDVTEEEFWRFVELVKSKGRKERWTPPEEWVRRWGGRPMTNHYLYLDDYAYWFTRRDVPMLNREHVSVQEETPPGTGSTTSRARCPEAGPSPREGARVCSILERQIC